MTSKMLKAYKTIVDEVMTSKMLKAYKTIVDEVISQHGPGDAELISKLRLLIGVAAQNVLEPRDFENLLEYAEKEGGSALFRPSGGKLKISVEELPEEERLVKIVFKDHMLVTASPEEHAENLEVERYALWCCGKVLKETDNMILVQMAGRTQRNTPWRVGRNQNQFFWVVKSAIEAIIELAPKEKDR